jgi:hypothetical protein
MAALSEGMSEALAAGQAMHEALAREADADDGAGWHARRLGSLLHAARYRTAMQALTPAADDPDGLKAIGETVQAGADATARLKALDGVLNEVVGAISRADGGRS